MTNSSNLEKKGRKDDNTVRIFSALNWFNLKLQNKVYVDGYVQVFPNSNELYFKIKLARAL